MNYSEALAEAKVGSHYMKQPYFVSYFQNIGEYDVVCTEAYANTTHCTSSKLLAIVSGDSVWECKFNIEALLEGELTTK